MPPHILFAKRFFWTFILSVVLLISGTACSSSDGSADNAENLLQTDGRGSFSVVATTSIIGDVVRQIGGDEFDLEVLLPEGTDPHGFEPSPRDIAKVADADLVFANGAGLEEFLQPLLQNAGGSALVVEVSQSIELLEGGVEEQDDEGEVHPGEEEHENDPHVWMDPNNVIIWTEVIEETLSEVDSENAAVYAANAEDYRQQLQQLDAWIRAEVAQVPANRRELVVDHQAFTYFTEAFGFQQVAAIIPGFNTLAEPSAQDLAQLEDAIRELDVRAIFVGNTVNPALAERIAADTDTKLVQLYTGSLSEAGGEADTYLKYMRYNVSAIVAALIP